MGTASGIVNLFSFVGGLAAPVVLGWALDRTGSFPAAFAACAGFEVVALRHRVLHTGGGRAVTASGS